MLWRVCLVFLHCYHLFRNQKYRANFSRRFGTNSFRAITQRFSTCRQAFSCVILLVGRCDSLTGFFPRLQAT
ncbi:hypothetical protein BDA96_01G466100 [Sorghum bicolor]|uniref:Uncharacterized protein n=1 Tax=Sorghum bicolor TaxID=4558 RepID=A0A921V185_SORBI|nr:hypothetical protein BDA96_01G466100 [Sorghum bicolor]